MAPRARAVKRGRRASANGNGALQLVRAAGAAPASLPEDHPSRWERPRLRTVVVASGKGGVGKSNLSANLAVALGEHGLRVLLLDADFGQANLDLLLGVHPRWDLQHVLSGEKTMEEIVVDGPSGVRLVPAASGVPELADLDDFRREVVLRGLGPLAESADLLIVDTASGVSRHVTDFCHVADETVIVTTPELPAFSDAYGLVKLLSQRGITRAPHLLVNMATSVEEAEETTHRIRLVARRFLRLEVDSWGHVPFDPAVARAVRNQEPVVTAFPQSPAALAYRSIAGRIAAGMRPDPPVRIEPASERLEA